MRAVKTKVWIVRVTGSKFREWVSLFIINLLRHFFCKPADLQWITLRQSNTHSETLKSQLMQKVPLPVFSRDSMFLNVPVNSSQMRNLHPLLAGPALLLITHMIKCVAPFVMSQRGAAPRPLPLLGQLQHRVPAGCLFWPLGILFPSPSKHVTDLSVAVSRKLIPSVFTGGCKHGAKYLVCLDMEIIMRDDDSCSP